jgi:dolichol-phosphate mannosyltransferase
VKTGTSPAHPASWSESATGRLGDDSRRCEPAAGTVADSATPEPATARPATSISIVAPCFNEQQVLPEFLRRVQLVCDALGAPYEIVLVDDGSHDATWSIICHAVRTNNRVLGVRLRRNHGHQLALSAGIAASRGDLLLLIDSDLQDPPESLPRMLDLMHRTHAEVVYGQRIRRAGEGMFKRFSASLFYRMLNWLSELEIPRDTGDFRLITRPVADFLCQMPERHRFVRGMVAWIGGTQVAFQYERDARHAGDSKYPLRRMLRLANDAITSFSRRPLQVATTVGLAVALFSLLLGCFSIFGWITGLTVPGWTSLMTVLGFFGALQFLMLGVIGEYLGRLYEQSRERPMFMEAERAGQGLSAPSALES